MSATILTAEAAKAANIDIISNGKYTQAVHETVVALRANRDAWEAIRLLPRVLRPLAGGHTRVELLGRSLAYPILLAPIAFQRLAVDGRILLDDAPAHEAREIAMGHAGRHACGGGEPFQGPRFASLNQRLQQFQSVLDGLDSLLPFPHPRAIPPCAIHLP